eukprot:Nitzschia sp. Nitz4//scaffold114_size70088//61651//62691//NITZ4_005990-RA/size70088-processed-gene-0.27-mRNA-1//1//CDS//3329533462//7983//frame0
MNAPCLPVRPNKKRRKGKSPRDNITTDVSGNSDTVATGNSASDDADVDQTSFDSFDAIETMDAAEYLARVVQQAKGMPDVFEAKKEISSETSTSEPIPSKYKNFVPIEGSAASLAYLVSDRSTLLPPPTPQHLPSHPESWIAKTLQNFETLREYLVDCRNRGIGGKETERIPVPPMKDRSGWHLFCVGPEEARGNPESYYGQEEEDGDEKEEEIPAWKQTIPSTGHIPTVHLLCQLDQVLIRRILAHLCHYTQLGFWLSPQRCQWFYALLARLETPIHREDAAILFELLKCLTRTRSKLDVGGSGSSKEREALARQNVLIVLVGIYLEQGSADTLMKVKAAESSKS